jgi:hypothetical protein
MQRWRHTGIAILVQQQFQVHQITFFGAFTALAKPGLVYSGEVASPN